MGVFDFLFGGQAPVHTAEVFNPCHDGRFHLLEARRGRGKSYGMTYWQYLWLVDRLPAILDGRAPYSRAIANFKIDHHRLALLLCTRGHMASFTDALDLVHERVIYARDWTPFFESYECGLFLDEANRSLDAYQRSSSALLKLAHDWHQQTRKHRNTLVYATQYVDWINMQTRKLFDLLWRAKVVRHKTKRGPDGLRVPLRFNYYGSDPYANGADATVVRRADFKMTLPFDLEVARCYGSWEPIVTFSGDTAVPWSSFEQLAADMLARGLKPAPTPPPVDRLALYAGGVERSDVVQLWPDVGPSSALFPAGSAPASGDWSGRTAKVKDAQLVCAASLSSERPGLDQWRSSAPLAPLDLSHLPTSARRV